MLRAGSGALRPSYCKWGHPGSPPKAPFIRPDTPGEACGNQQIWSPPMPHSAPPTPQGSPSGVGPYDSRPACRGRGRSRRSICSAGTCRPPPRRSGRSPRSSRCTSSGLQKAANYAIRWMHQSCKTDTDASAAVGGELLPRGAVAAEATLRVLAAPLAAPAAVRALVHVCPTHHEHRMQCRRMGGGMGGEPLQVRLSGPRT